AIAVAVAMAAMAAGLALPRSAGLRGAGLRRAGLRRGAGLGLAALGGRLTLGLLALLVVLTVALSLPLPMGAMLARLRLTRARHHVAVGFALGAAPAAALLAETEGLATGLRPALALAFALALPRASALAVRAAVSDVVGGQALLLEVARVEAVADVVGRKVLLVLRARGIRRAVSDVVVLVLHFLVGVIGRRGLVHPGEVEEVLHLLLFHLADLAALHVARQLHAAEAHAHEAAHHEAHRFHHAAHLAVLPLAQDHVVPVVGALAAAILEGVELAELAVDVHAGDELLALLLGELPHHAHRVLALDLEARVREPVGELAARREDEQALRVEVEPPHGHPARAVRLGKPLEHGRALLRVVARHDLAGGLVVEQHARELLAEAKVDEVAVELHLVAGAHGVAELGELAVHRDVALRDEDLDVAPRAVARLRHHLLQALALAGARSPVPLAAAALAAPLVGVVLRLGPFRHDAAGPFQLVLGVGSIPHGFHSVGSVGCSPESCESGRLSVSRAACCWGSVSRADCSSSRGGSSSSVLRLRSSRNFRVVAKIAGRPGVSRWPITSTQPRSTSAFSVGGETATPRTSSMSPRVTGCR